MKSYPGSTILCPVLIGRVSQLETLYRLIEQVIRSAGNIALVAGEAGIGKSRLVNEARNQAAQYGFRLLQGSCFEPDRALPYAPVLDLLHTFSASHSDHEIAGAFGTAASELIKLVPELATLLGGATPSPTLEPEAEKRRLFNALAQFFTERESSERSPLMIIIEDLHWSDDTSLEFLLYLARRIAPKPILLLLTYRTEETNPALDHFLVDLNRERLATELVLQQLSRAEMNEMLRAMLETDHPLSDVFQQKLYALTEGNPFFIEEVVKALTNSGSIFLEQGQWKLKPVNELRIPRSIKDSVQNRTANLSSQARCLLELAAVAGRRFDFNLLQGLAQLDEQELLFLVKELVSAQLVVE
jgi:predicted ATPase